MAYLPIEDHGIIGNLDSVALVGRNGLIDWCCLPAFDSPSIFCSLLDDEIGGGFSVSAERTVNSKQQYLPESAILVTRSYCEGGLGHVEDFMPIVDGQSGIAQIVRRLSCVRGEVVFKVECEPAFDYARVGHHVKRCEGGYLFIPEKGDTYVLLSPLPLRRNGERVKGRVHLKEGETMSLVFARLGSKDERPVLENLDELYRQTLEYWQSWMQHCNYTGRWDYAVRRSALTLKLLTYRPTGTIVAAPTMGLPSVMGGERNWDYRYTWIRDAAFTLYALMRVGHTEEAGQFIHWLTDRASEAEFQSPAPLHLMYGIDGRHELEETTLDHLKGYRCSRPVRLGNAAYKQLQLDIYGELMDSIYLHNKYGSPVSYKVWKYCRRIANWVAENWDQPDEGIWETRGGRKNFVYSRLMCWVALDRAARMASKYSLPGKPWKWIEQRDLIYDQIMEKGWSEKRKAFRQHYDSDAMDAANLLMPLVKFISPTDPRMISTIDAILESLTTDSLVYRYDLEESPDGLEGDEGTFSICTFWLVECLTRAGRLNEARAIFERMLSYSNHVGLYSEGIGLKGEALGNFPQAFTHLSLISAGFNLNRAFNRRGGNPSEHV